MFSRQLTNNLRIIGGILIMYHDPFLTGNFKIDHMERN